MALVFSVSPNRDPHLSLWYLRTMVVWYGRIRRYVLKLLSMQPETNGNRNRRVWIHLFQNQGKRQRRFNVNLLSVLGRECLD